MQQLLAVGLGGFVGAIARFSINGLLQNWMLQKLGREYPAGTLAVNVLGCLLIGVMMAFVHERPHSETVRLLLVTGFLGSLTTFSTFGYDTFELLRDSNLRIAFWYVGGNFLVGLAAVWAGDAVTRQILS